MDDLVRLLQLPAYLLLIAFLSIAVVTLWNTAKGVIPLLPQMTTAVVNFSAALVKFSALLDQQRALNVELIERLIRDREFPAKKV